MPKSGAIAATIVVAFFAAFIPAAFADDWVAVKLRGGVFALVDGGWVQLERGAVVSDDRVVRTQPSGRVTFVRGEETIELGASTQIQIIDRTGKQFTTVKQHYGKVEIEAQVQNVQHFAVVTPYLAAVVKGTKFVVTSGDAGSEVAVKRGHVAVEDSTSHYSVEIAAGQSVSAGPDAVMAVEGSGELPVVVDAEGQPLNVAADGSLEDVIGNSGNGNGNSGNGNGNSGNGNSGNGNSGNGNSGGGNGNSGSGSGVSVTVTTPVGTVSVGSSGNGKGNSGKGKGNV